MNHLSLIPFVALLYFFTGYVSLDFLEGHNIVNLGLFPPEGIALAFALYFGKKILPGIFLGQLFLALYNHIDPLTAITIGIINTTEAYIALVLFHKFRLHKTLHQFRDIVLLAGIILFILQPFSSIFSNFTLYLAGYTPIDTLPFSIFSWWFGNIMGQFLFTPFLLLLFSNYKKLNIQEYLLFGAIFTFYIYILEIIIVIKNPLFLLSLTLPIILIVTAKKGTHYGMFLSVIATTITSYSIANDTSAFLDRSMVDNIINFNLFVLALTSLVITIGILFDEKKRYQAELEEKIELGIKKNQEQEILMLQQSRFAQMGEMISMIAHQWRQPLNNLSLINQILISKYYKNKLTNDTIEYFKEHSQKQITLMSKTIDDFRNFFKKESIKETFYINDIIQEIFTMTEAIYTSNGIVIEFHPKKRYSYFGYANALTQVILNIVNNARDALSEKHTKEKKILIDITENSDEIIINIQDNAGGVPEDIIDKIFDPYFSTKLEKNGTGLGLYMSKMIIQEQMQAKIDVHNTHKGACFTLRLPKESVNDQKSSNVENE